MPRKNSLLTYISEHVDETEYYCLRYSTPKGTLRGKTGRCIHSEAIWNKINSKDPDDFKVIDYEARNTEDIHKYFKPKIKAAQRYIRQRVSN